jgi:hypothetical protein
LPKLSAGHIGALTTMREALVLTAFRHRAFAVERIPVSFNPTAAAVGFPVCTPLAQQPTAGLHSQQIVDHKLRALIVDPQRRTFRSEFDDAVIRIGFAAGEMVDEPINPALALCFLVGEDFRVADKGDVIAVSMVTDACPLVAEQAFCLVRAHARGEIRREDVFRLDGRYRGNVRVAVFVDDAEIRRVAGL